jgi:hypothetical protein
MSGAVAIGSVVGDKVAEGGPEARELVSTDW